MRITVAQIGARRHYAIPVALHRAGMLESFHTDWCANRGVPNLIGTLMRQTGLRGRWNRIDDRQVPELPARSIVPHLGHALRMARLRRSGGLSNDAYWARANGDFGRTVVRSGFGRANGVYGFNAAAVEIFVAAKDRGLTTILDQTMAAWKPVQRLLDAERARWPDWSLATSEGNSELLADREQREWERADLVICGSSFVVDTLRETGVPVEKCRVVPYGYDGGCASTSRRPRRSGPLRVLFVGTVDLRKGIPYLFQAAHQIDRGAAEFRMVGPVQVSEAAVSQLRERIDVVGACPRSAVGAHYEWADVFVLPTLAEGSANVCYEAMSHGLPVITTPNAGSVVRDRVDGWIVPARSVERLADALRQAIDHREQLAIFSENALTRAASFTWHHYMKLLTATLSAALPASP